MSATTLKPTDRNFFESRRELFCDECNHGIVVSGDPPDCPICRSAA